MQTTGEQKSVLRGLFAGTALAVLSLTMSVFAAPVPIERVKKLAGGIASSVQVSRSSGAVVRMAQAVSPAEAKVSAVSPVNAKDTAFYVIDRGSTGGFVVLSADDRLDPVLVIAPTGSFDSTPGTPLYDMLCGDVRKRVADADAKGARQSEGWRALLDETDPLATAIAYAGVSSIDDVRVEPLVQSKWDQSTVGGKKVYNYYTPNGYVCGCVATAGSQIMRFHRCPTKSVTPVTHRCWVGGVATSMTMYGGTYDWNNMPLVPTSSISDTECEAIGKLTYDLGVAVYMSWASGGSGTGGYCLKDAFLDVFGYKNAMAYQLRSGTFSGTAIENALLANFDAGYPVELGIDGSAGGHSIVGDGYGYSSGSLYVHLNLGWGGGDDAWYHLPNIGTWAGFNVVDGAVYNIFPDGTGDLLTGRVLDASTGEPIPGATVQALDGSSVVGSTTTSAAGIYALRLPGNKTYSVIASASGAQPSEGAVYLQKSETTWTSEIYYTPGTGTIGNSWGNDFELVMSTDPVAPATPTGVSASDGTSTAKIRITWNASSGATDYKIYRNDSDSSASATLLASSVKTSYYDDTTAEVGTTYYYWVIAHNSIGYSEYSASDCGWRAYAVPDAPTGVSATDGTRTDGVAVTWNSVSGATSYSVWRSDTSSSTSASCLMNGITETSYTDTKAVEGKTYWYWVKATSQGGTSAFSASDYGYRQVSVPVAPTGVSASDGLSSTEIVISWNAVLSATSYSVWRGTSSSSAQATQIASGLTTTSYADTSVTAGTHYYWVKATNVGGTSDFSDPDTGSLAAIVGPTSVSASDGAYSGYVKISWAKPQSANSYEVWRGTVNAYSLAERIATPTSTSHNDSTAEPGMLYYYWVRAVTSSGTSAFSASDSGYRPLSVPTGIGATSGNETGVTVSWSSVTGATSYQVGRCEQAGSTPSVTLGSATSLSYKDTTAVPGVTYKYFVRAVAPACTSGWSASATGSRSVPTPENLTASDGTYTDRILVTWPALSGATSYELMRASENNIAEAELIATTTSTSYSDRTAEYGLTYYYFLRAKFAVGTSPWSASVAGRRAFPAPTGVSAADSTATANIVVTWDAIEGVQFFQVWRYSNERGRNELVGTSTTTSYKDSKNVEPGVRYTYRVKAVFATGSSAFSEPDKGSLKASSPTVKASDGTSTSQISLSWASTAGAVSYLIYRSTTSSSADAVQIASTSMLYYDDTAVARETIYYYWVRTATALDTSDFGTADSGYIGLPGASRVTATDGTYADKVVVSWNVVSGAQTYEIWRGDSDESSSATRVMRGVKTTSWEDTEVTPGARCWYWVKACITGGGAGLWGASDSGYRTLAAPTSVTATTDQTDGVKVAWKGTTTGVYFEILRGVTDNRSQAAVIATVDGKANYLDNTAVPGYRYYYWVRAYSELCESAWSSSVDGFRMISAPAAVKASDGTSLESVTITWAEATSAKRYEIWRSEKTTTATAELIGTTNKLVWVDADVEPGVLYYYWIKSVSALDTSDFSTRDSGYVSTPIPTDVTASDGEAPSYVRISWTESDGAATYTVRRAESENAEMATELRSGLTSTTYDDTSAIPGKFYWYWVCPVSAAGPGLLAGPDRGFALLSAPTAVTATSNLENRVTVSWKSAKGATSYEVFRGETDDVESATNAVFATVTTTSYGDTNAVPAVKYWYWVRAVSEADVSPIAGPADGFRLLSVPKTVVASDGVSTDFVRIAWSETWGAASYEVWRAENSTSSSAASFLAGVTNELEYLDTTATAGVSYTYWLKAVSELHTTGFSTTYDKGWRSLPAPAKVTASDGTLTTGIGVEWTPVEGATKYEICWVKEGDTTTNKFTTTDANICAYTNTSSSIQAGVRYWFWVRTHGATGTGAGVFSEPDDGYRAIAGPTNVKATDGTLTDSVRVTWGAPTGATRYEVRVAATNELYAATTNLYTVTGTSFDDTNAVPGIIYRYWVRAFAPMCSTDFVGPDEGYRKLQKVMNVDASDGSSLDAVELSWTWPEGVTRCQVWRSEGTTVSAATKIATVTEPTYVDAAALHGVKYYYWVNAVADVQGEMSANNTGWRGLIVPGDIVATDGDSTAHTRITWSASPDATKYQVWRGTSADPSTMKKITPSDISASAALAWEDTTGTPGALYYYSVMAGGTGGWSELGVGDTGYKALTYPTGVSATDGTQVGKVSVQWNAVTGATHYRVYRADSEDGEKVELGGWQTTRTFADTTVQGTRTYWYFVKAAADETGARPSAYSGGDTGYAKDGGGTVVQPVEFGGGISWPVTDNGDGTTTTNGIEFASVEGGRLRFSGIVGEVGATTTVQVEVKTSLDSKAAVYTTPATLKIVSPGTGEVDLSTVWGAKTSLFVIGVTTKEGTPLP